MRDAVRLLPLLLLMWRCGDGARSAGGTEAPSAGSGTADAAIGDAGDAASPALYAGARFSASARPPAAACLRQAGAFVGTHDFNYTVDWSPSDDLLLVGTIGMLRVLALDRAQETLRELATYNQPDSQVHAQWSPDGRYALSAGQDVRLLEVVRTDDSHPATVEELARYTGHTASVIAIAWSPDGSAVLTASKDETVRWLAVDRANGRLSERAVFHGHEGRVFGVAWSPDGRHAASVGEDHTLRLLAVDSARGELRELAQVTGADWKDAVTWADGDRPLLAGDWGLFNQIDMWSVDVTGGRLLSEGTLTTFDRVGVQTIAWSPAGDLLAAAAHDDNGLQLFSYADRHFEGVATLMDWHYGVHAVSWSHDGSRLAVAAAYSERVVVLDVSGCAR